MGFSPGQPVRWMATPLQDVEDWLGNQMGSSGHELAA